MDEPLDELHEPLVLHVSRGFSAEPTLSMCLPGVRVVELPLVEALARPREASVVWASSAGGQEVERLHAAYPRARLMVSVPRGCGPECVVDLYRRGADLVADDEGVRHAAAAVGALLRRVAQVSGTQVSGAQARERKSFSSLSRST